METYSQSPITVSRRRDRTPKKRADHANLSERGGRYTLTRNKNLLRAALRVWELKQRLPD